MSPDLGRNLIETESPCEDEHQQRSDPHRGINPNHNSQCQAPRQTSRRHPAT